MKTACLYSLVLLGMAAGIYAQTDIRPIDQDRFERLKAEFREKLDRSLPPTKIAGATVGCVLPDGRSFSVSSGVSNLTTRTVLRPADPILAGSIGKTFVSALTLQLVQEGRLDLDDRIEKWLGTKAWFPRLPNAHDITLRMLMNHSSGIPNHVELKSFEKASLAGWARDIAYDDLIAFILDKKPLFPAGKGFYYADTNYILVAMITEKITGRTMYAEVIDRFLKPLKLDHTAPAIKNVEPTVYGYYQGKPAVTDGHLIINPQWEWAGGGFTSTAEDLARWAKYLYGGTVMDNGSLDRMIKSTSTGDGQNYGLGVEITKSKWGTSLGHDGEYPGYLSVMRYYQRYGFAVAAQINTDGSEEAQRFIDSAADDYAALVVEQLVDKKLSGAEKTSFSAMAESWLHLIDAAKFGESWDRLSTELRAKYTREQWPAALEPFLKKTGKFKKRQLRSVVYSEPDVIAVDYDSVFSKLPAASETVFLKHEADGNWRISSYSVH